MKRKIIKQGHNTLTMTLPSKWAQNLNIKPGDEIDVLEKGDSIVINGKENSSEKKAVIDITNFTIPLVWRYIQGAYRAGCTEIKIIFDPNKNLHEDPYHYFTTHSAYAELGEKIPKKTSLTMIQTIVDRFIGMGIIETGKNFCTIKEMGELTPKEFENSMRRIFLVILHMFDRLLDAIEKEELGSVDICKEFHTIDLNVDRLVDYCCRILNKISTSFPDNQKTLLFSTLFLLEIVGDEFKYISKHLALTKKSLQETLPFAQKIKEHFEIYYKLFYKFDREEVIKLSQDNFNMWKTYYEEKDKSRKQSQDQTGSILGHLKNMGGFTFDLTELRIEMEF
jgi:phosphate uptake regulator